MVDVVAPVDRQELRTRLRRLRENREFDEAAVLLAAASERAPRDRELAVESGRLQLDRGDAAEALETFTRLAKRAPAFEPAAAWRIAALDRLFEFDEAADYTAEALERFPDGVDVRTAAIRLYADRSRENEALELCDALLGDHPDHADTLLNRVDLLRLLGRRQDAIEAARTAVERRPDDPDTLAAAGLGLTTSAPECADEGLGHIRRAVELDPDNAAALGWLGEALRHQSRWREAEEALRDAIVRRPRVPDLRVELAYVLSGLHREDEALVCCADALKTDPRHRWALRARVDFLRTLRRWEDAERAARELIDRHPRNPYSYVSLGSVFDNQDRHDEALAAYDEALKIDPRDGDALEWRVTSLRKLGRWPEAESAARAAVELRPLEPRLRTELAWVLWGGDRAEDALAAAAEAARTGERSVWALRSHVSLLRLAQRWPEAEAAARELVDALPREAGAYLELALVLDAQDRDEEALAEYDRALALDPADAAVLTGRARVLRGLERWADAEQAARAAVDAAPDEAEPWVGLALSLSALKRSDEALDAIGEALRLQPRNEAALRARVEFLRFQRRWSDAEAAARGLIEAFPQSGAHLELALVLEAQDRDEEALAEYDQALALDPADGDALKGRARVLHELRRWPEAESAARAAIAAAPDDSEPRIGLTHALSRQGRLDDALQAVADALGANPRAFWALGSRVRLLRELRRWDDAERAARDLIDAHPNLPGSHVALGRVLLDQDRHVEALERFDHALTLGPAGETALGWRIGTLRFLGRWDEAESAARAAVQLLPASPVLCLHLAWTILSQRRHDEALAHVTKALRLDSRNSWALATHVTILRRLRRWPEAEAAAREFIDARPDDAVSYTNLGWVFSDLEREADALAEYERALAVDPVSESALVWRVTALRRLRRWADAERAAREAIGRLPHVPNLHVVLAQIHSDQRRYPDALRAVERALVADPWSRQAQNVRMSVLIRLDRATDAETAARAYAAARPDVIDAHGILATALDRQHRYPEALAEFEAARRINPHDARVIRGMSATYRAMGCFAEAERLVDAALVPAPDRPGLLAELAFARKERRAYVAADGGFVRVGELATGPNERAGARAGRGWVAAAEGRRDDAVGHFIEAVGLDPTSAGHRVGLAWALLRRGRADDLDRAAEACHEALELDSFESRAQSCLGMIAFRRGDNSAAEHHFRRSIDLAPYDGSHLDLGALFVLVGRYDDAEPCLRRALELDPWSARAHVELGNLYLRRSDGAPGDDSAQDAHAAAAEFRRALAVDPHSGTASLGLALALVRASGDLTAAEQALRDALEQPGGDQPVWQLHLALARLLVQAGDATQDANLYQEAVDTAGAAIKQAADEPDAYFVAGVAEQRLGAATDSPRLRLLHRRRAVAYLKSCQGKDPGRVDAARALRRLEEEREVVRASRTGSLVLVTVATAILGALWVDFVWKHHVTSVMATTLTPVLVGLIAIGFLMPLLVRLKVPGGLEADLSASIGHLSTGPTGTITISSPGFPAGAGPTGEIPRLP